MNDFYTIKVRKGLNNKNEVWVRTRIIYGHFLDNINFEYKYVTKAGIESEDTIRHFCTWSDLLKHDNNKIYEFHTYEDALKIQKLVHKDNIKIKMHHIYLERVPWKKEKLEEG